MAQNDSDAKLEYHVEDYIEKWEERGQVYFTPKQRQFTKKSPVSNKAAEVSSPVTNKAAAVNSPVTNIAATSTSPINNKASKPPPPVKALDFTPYTTNVQQNEKTQMSAMKSKMMTKQTFVESLRALSAKVEGLESQNKELGNRLLKMEYKNKALSNKIVQLEDRYMVKKAVELEEVQVDNIDTKNDGKKKTRNKERSVWCSCCRRKN